MAHLFASVVSYNIWQLLMVRKFFGGSRKYVKKTSLWVLVSCSVGALVVVGEKGGTESVEWR